MREITIKNTKGIKELSFSFPDQSGVYLLVGANGVGKTTLLICMERICNSHAFARGFTTTKSWSAIDQFNHATVEYKTDTTCVKFRKKVAKWAPTPKKGSAALLEAFGFSNVIFVRADSRRIDITQDDLRAGNFVSADQEIKDTLNALMETDKYSNLMRLRNSNGRGRQATFFYVLRDVDGTRYSEKRFSTGELALLRLVEQLKNAADHTLVLVDEAEMALHPRVQANLINYLREKTEGRDITVFVSTHSPAMIKAVNKERIIKLDDCGDGHIETVSPCYPAAAIGCVDFETSTIFDYILFVEDEMARLVLKELIKRYIRLEPAHATALISIVAVGGFYQTADIAVKTRSQIFAQSKVFALLDQDAFEDIDAKPKFKVLYDDNPDIIKSLTFTPEVWLIGKIVEANYNLKQSIRARFHAELTSILQSEEYCSCCSQKTRKLAKDQWGVIVDSLQSTSGDCKDIVGSQLISIIVESISESSVRSILGPILGR